MMSDHVKAPWSESQCMSLNTYQVTENTIHPYTCGTEGCRGILIATREGWRCPYCYEWKQDWALRWVSDWTWDSDNIRSKEKSIKENFRIRGWRWKSTNIEFDELKNSISLIMELERVIGVYDHSIEYRLERINKLDVIEVVLDTREVGTYHEYHPVLFDSENKLWKYLDTTKHFKIVNQNDIPDPYH